MVSVLLSNSHCTQRRFAFPSVHDSNRVHRAFSSGPACYFGPSSLKSARDYKLVHDSLVVICQTAFVKLSEHPPIENVDSRDVAHCISVASNGFIMIVMAKNMF